MTAAQFTALAQLLRLRDGAAQDAARLVLVNGRTPGQAATETGISPASVSNAVSRIKRGLELARIAVAA